MSNIKRYQDDKEEYQNIIQANFLDEFHRQEALNIGKIKFTDTEKDKSLLVEFTYFRDKHYISRSSHINWKREKYTHNFKFILHCFGAPERASSDLKLAFSRFEIVAELQDRVKEYQREIKVIQYDLKNEYSPKAEAVWKLRR